MSERVGGVTASARAEHARGVCLELGCNPGSRDRRNSRLKLGLCLGALAAAGAGAMIAPTANAADFPAKQLRMIVPYPAGGGADTIARLLVSRLSGGLSERFIVENRPGAAGIIGSELVAKATPDGSVWMLVVASHAINAASGRKLPYDTERDFAPVTLVGWGANVVAVHPSLPVRSVRELVALARTRPNAVQYASFGAGSVSHLSGELFNLEAKVALTHVPYRGAAPAMIDLVGGHVPLAFGSLASTMTYVREGKLRALAVTSRERSPLAPELPTLAESGLSGFDTREWWGVFGPAGLAAELAQRMHRELTQAIAVPEVRTRLNSLGAETISGDPARLGSFLGREIARWREIIRKGGIAVE
jgi:tripartite-type tricarboxylate transporter receptor subunit TctC